MLQQKGIQRLEALEQAVAAERGIVHGGVVKPGWGRECPVASAALAGVDP
jgi:hypothetical protein